MPLVRAKPLTFFPAAGPPRDLARAGFRLGDKGTHSSRTLMLAELGAVLRAAPPDADRAAYTHAIVSDNCLGKPTTSTRRISNQRLAELYTLDQLTPLFRILRHLWTVDPPAQPTLAMLAALARDPLFMASASAVLSLAAGVELQRAPVRDALRAVTGERMNDAVLDKVVRNVSSSWTQTGHLKGRTFKFRQRVEARPTAVAFALWLGHAAGLRSNELLTSGWVAALDCTASSATGLANEARRLGLMEFRAVHDVVEFGFDRLDPGVSRR